MSKQTLVAFLLDETGSMQTIKDDVIGGFNAYVKTLRESGEQFLFSLVKFYSNKTETVHSGISIKDVDILTKDNYLPGAMTPLIDACVKIIKATEEKLKSLDKQPNVQIIVQTDGYENASTEYSRADLASLVKEKTAVGWLFTFLGAGIDAFTEASKYGFDAGQTLSATQDLAGASINMAARGTVAYAQSGNATAAQWTDAERAQTGSPKPPTTTTKSSIKKKSFVDNITI